jgi:multicomponent Na+:H+ antiporter subunit G
VNVLPAILTFTGVAVVGASALGAMLARTPLSRLHFLTPITSLAAPLIGAGLVAANGWNLGSAAVVVIVVLLGVTGPVVQSATGRLYGQRERLLTKESSSAT